MLDIFLDTQHNPVETDLYYLQSRYYDPNTGRFINADDTSVLQATQGDLLGANLFAYCYNNPVMLNDPSGYLTIAEINALLYPKVNVYLRASPICPSSVRTAINITNWNKTFNLNRYISMRISGKYEVYTFTETKSDYQFYNYDIWVRVNSFLGWLKYIKDTYGSFATLKADMEYLLSILGSVATIPYYISFPGAVISVISEHLPYYPKEARFIMRMLENYKANNNSIYIPYHLDYTSFRAKRKYFLWGPIVRWDSFITYSYFKTY